MWVTNRERHRRFIDAGPLGRAGLGGQLASARWLAAGPSVLHQDSSIVAELAPPAACRAAVGVGPAPRGHLALAEDHRRRGARRAAGAPLQLPPPPLLPWR